MAKTNKSTLFRKVAVLYKDMEEQYEQVATEIGLTCRDCPENCCTSFFQHHTYIEWAYFWKGIRALPPEKQELFQSRAREYVQQAGMILAQGGRPKLMCPVNEQGLCQVYEHRFMICRMHGVPNAVLTSRGTSQTFPGCFRTQEIASSRERLPVLDRTPLYRRLAKLEMEYVGKKMGKVPRVNLTLAQMLVQGPPPV